MNWTVFVPMIAAIAIAGSSPLAVHIHSPTIGYCGQSLDLAVMELTMSPSEESRF